MLTLCISHCTGNHICNISFNPHNATELSANIVSVLQMGKLRHRLRHSPKVRRLIKRRTLGSLAAAPTPKASPAFQHHQLRFLSSRE